MQNQCRVQVRAQLVTNTLTIPLTEMSLFVDADYIAYKVCAACEDEIDYGNDTIVVISQFSEVVKSFDHEIRKIERFFEDPEQEVILFFSGPNNFRKKIDPEYKGHRNRKKPCGYKRLINHCADHYMTVMVDELEADDTIGIYATTPGENEFDNVVISPDKDLRQIPGLLWDMKSQFVEMIPYRNSVTWHFIQTLAGDQTDGYAGVPGYGVKRATTYLDKEGYTWDSIVKAFEAAGLTEEDALRNARLSKILQHENYDHEKEQPKLWTPQTPDPWDTPPASAGTDDGAAVQTEKDKGSSAEGG